MQELLFLKKKQNLAYSDPQRRPCSKTTSKRGRLAKRITSTRDMITRRLQHRTIFFTID